MNDQPSTTYTLLRVINAQEKQVVIGFSGADSEREIAKSAEDALHSVGQSLGAFGYGPNVDRRDPLAEEALAYELQDLQPGCSVKLGQYEVTRSADDGHNLQMNQSPYLNAHGKMPFGKGGWAFNRRGESAIHWRYNAEYGAACASLPGRRLGGVLMSPKMPQYPEHEKLLKIKTESNTIGEFLEWLESEGTVLAGYSELDQLLPEHEPIRDRLARYFGIDQSKIEQEKRAMLENLQEKNNGKT